MSTNTENFKTEQKAKWADGKRANGANFAQLFDAIARLIEDEVTSVPATDIPAAIKEFLDNSDKYSNTDAFAKLKEAMKKPETLKDALDAVGALDASDATKTAIANALKVLNPGAGVTVADLEQAASGEEFSGLDEATRQANERASKIRQAVAGIAGKKDNAKHYVFLAGMGEVKIWKYSDNSEAEVVSDEQTVHMDVYVQNEKGFAVPFVDGTVTNASTLPAGLTDVWLLTTTDGARYVYNKTNNTLNPAVSLIG
jgi:hypothetical protein